MSISYLLLRTRLYAIFSKAETWRKHWIFMRFLWYDFPMENKKNTATNNPEIVTPLTGGI